MTTQKLEELRQMDYAALMRAFAKAKSEGDKETMKAIDKIVTDAALRDY